MKGRFALWIDLGNAAMSEPEHIADMLDHVAIAVRGGITEGPLRDVNGNTVGGYQVNER